MKKGTPKKQALTKKIQNSIRKIRKTAKAKPASQKTTAKKIAKPTAKKKTVFSRLRRKPAKTAKKKESLVEVQSTETQTATAVENHEYEQREQVEVSKYSVAEIQTQQASQYNLPYRYHDDRITLLARDPWWLYTYWDISEQKVNEVVSSIPSNEREGLNWILRVHDVTDTLHFDGHNSCSYFDLGVNFDTRNWYINIQQLERKWCVELGLVTNSGKFYMVARSNIVGAPYFGVSDVIDEEWAIADEDYYKIFGGKSYDLAGKSSFERRKIIEKAVTEQISSGAFSGAVSSFSSYMGKPKERKFFLEVWTEVIVYGRTEPTAKVTLCGNPVKLNPDGTFSSRYDLPEGDFEYEVVGQSEDGVDTITKIPAVKRYTKK